MHGTTVKKTGTPTFTKGDYTDSCVQP